MVVAGDYHRSISSPDVWIASGCGFASSHIRQQSFIIPSLGAKFFPAVVTRTVSAHVNHTVDSAGSTQYLSAWPLVHNVVCSTLHNRLIRPVCWGVPQAQPPCWVCHCGAPLA